MVFMRKSRLSQYKQGHLIKHFVSGTMARIVTSLIGANFKRTAYYVHRLREIIAHELCEPILGRFLLSNPTDLAPNVGPSGMRKSRCYASG